MKTSELTGPALDWAVAQAAIKDGQYPIYMRFYTDGSYSVPHWGQSGSSERFCPSTRGDHAVPIIERECISLDQRDGWPCRAYIYLNACEYLHAMFAPEHQPLTAAMRCFVASRLGDEVDVPEELTS